MDDKSDEKRFKSTLNEKMDNIKDQPFSDNSKKIGSSDDSKSIKLNSNSIQLYLTILFSCIGGFLFGYDTGKHLF